MDFKVIDASVLLHSHLNFGDAVYLAPNSVIQEIIDDRVRVLVDSALRDGRLRVAEPSSGSVEKVLSTASESGDAGSLSEADVDVLALALDNKAAVVSDDYALQNTARLMGLKVEGCAQEGIRKTVKWSFFCGGCGRKYGPGVQGVCGVCGSRLRKKPVT